jgi:hypothetical protein
MASAAARTRNLDEAELVRLKAELIGRILGRQLPSGAVVACRAEVTVYVKQAIDGAEHIADEILRRVAGDAAAEPKP